MSSVNKSYYDFIFTTNLGKTCTVKIPNAVIKYEASIFKPDMDEIIRLNVIQTSTGSPAVRKKVIFDHPREFDVAVS